MRPVGKIAADFRSVSETKDLRQLHEVKVNCQLTERFQHISQLFKYINNH